LDSTQILFLNTDARFIKILLVL